MQSKGKLGSIIAGVIAIFLVIVCAFYLSFSFVSSSHEKKADEFAKAQVSDAKEFYAKIPEAKFSEDSVYNQAYKQYMDSVGEKKVYLGLYTLNDVRKWGVGLGLDLKGGMNVILEIDIPDMLRNSSTKGGDANFEAAIAETQEYINDNPDKNFIETFVANYRQKEPNINLSVVFKDNLVPSDASDEKVVSILKEKVGTITETAANNVLRKRIDQFGVVSPNIQILEGKDGQILLELPGVKDHQQVRELLSKSASLEFYDTYAGKDIAADLAAGFQKLDPEVYDVPLLMGIAQSAAQSGGPTIAYIKDAKQRDMVNRAINAVNLPDNVKLLWGVKEITNDKQEKIGVPLYALRADNGEADLRGGVVVDASTNYDPINGNEVTIRMNSEGTRKWAAMTRRNAQEGNRPIAIVLDDQVYSAPSVRTAIEDGVSQITGDFTLEEAADLANVLKSGEMTAKINIISDMVIGPSLGKQAIKAGVTSFIVALILLMLFMCTFYGIVPGLIADFCLICNLFFTLGILASFQAVLTMSGIAGIVLSLGMAVDANVLIFERAKEELRAGKNVRMAISDGYNNAFSAIFDSNLTSIITGVILLLYGTGPIKGFATTLIIGIVCSFFTAVFLSRIFFNWYAKAKSFSKLTFSTPVSRKMFVNSHINFLGQRNIAFSVVAVVVAIVCASFLIRGLNQGIDFSGGRNYMVKFDKPVEVQEIRDVLSEEFDGSSVSVITIESSSQVRVSTNYKIKEGGEQVEQEITEKLFKALKPYFTEEIEYEQFSTKDADRGLVSSQKVGPSVAQDMRTDAYIAVGLALLAMFLYILFRFRNIAFSLGALAAVAFTAFTIVGFYSLFYARFPFAMEIDQSFIAAILTVIGYQINDTVVVFDRVRENVGLYPKQSFFATINQSINSTLGRTIMTSASTLLVLLCIFILGGDSIRSFTFAMIFGVIIGTLSTIYIASPVAYLTDSHRKSKGSKKVADKAPVAKKA